MIDGQNRRVGKKVNGALVEGFVYRNQLQPAVWLNGDGSVRATFVYGLQANVPEYMVKGGTTYRLITDQVGSVRLMVDSAGNVAERTGRVRQGARGQRPRSAAVWVRGRPDGRWSVDSIIDTNEPPNTSGPVGRVAGRDRNFGSLIKAYP